MEGFFISLISIPIGKNSVPRTGLVVNVEGFLKHFFFILFGCLR
jgi:hypothetical protein